MKQSPKTRVDEDKLVGFARSYLAEGFPNPHRIGCPPVDALRRLAERPTSLDLPITAHLGSCSPCFQQYQELLAETRAKKQPMAILQSLLRPAPKFAVIAAVICLAIIGLSVALWMSHKREIVHQNQNQPKINSPENRGNRVAEYVPVIVDMRKAAQVRGTKGTNPSVITLPRRPLHVSVYLPMGSDIGEYRVSLKRGEQPVWSGVGTAQVRDRRIVMEFEHDVSSYPPGRYTLMLSSKGGMRLIQQVIVEDPTKAK
jgi:hypothetical protein